MAVSRNPFNGANTGAFLRTEMSSTADNIVIQIVDEDGNSVPGIRSFLVYSVASTGLPVVNVASGIATVTAGACIKVAAAAATIVETWICHTDANGTFASAATDAVYIGCNFNNDANFVLIA